MTKGSWEEAFRNKGGMQARPPAANPRQEEPKQGNPAVRAKPNALASGAAPNGAPSRVSNNPDSDSASPKSNAESQKPVEGASAKAPSESSQDHMKLLKRLRGPLDGIWSTVQLKDGSAPRSLLVCGATKGEGATFFAFHLALFLCAEYGLKVLLVDTAIDWPQPTVFNGKDLPGLGSFYLHKQPLDTLITKTECKGLYVLPSGASQIRGQAGAGFLRGELLDELLAYCNPRFDVTVFDGQPVIASPSMFVYAKKVQQVILVIRYAQTRREVTKVVVDKMEEVGASIAGAILNERLYPIPPKIYRLLR